MYIMCSGISRNQGNDTCHPLGSPKVLENFAAKLARISAYKWCDYKKLRNAFFKNNFQLKGFYHLTNSYSWQYNNCVYWY